MWRLPDVAKHAVLCASCCHNVSRRLQAGDVLLLSASTKWAEEHRQDRAFVMLSEVPNSNPPKKRSMIIAVLLAVGMITTQVSAPLRSAAQCVGAGPCVWDGGGALQGARTAARSGGRNH